MKVVILGAGKIGYEIAKALSLNENDVSVVDSSYDTLKIVGERLDVKPVLGMASDTNVLEEAGIQSADILIAATSSDEVNIIACQLADFLYKTEIKIARVSKKSYFSYEDMFSKSNFPVDLIVSPEKEVANVIKRNIAIPKALEVISCVGDRVRIIGIICKKNSALANAQLKYMASIVKDTEIAILYIKRDGASIIPTKLDYILPLDEVYIAIKYEDLSVALFLFGYEGNETSNVIFIGGGNVCEEIVNTIFENEPDVNIKIIERDIAQAEFLSERLNNVEILHGSSLDIDVLNAARVFDSGIVIAMTSDDRTNILSCLLSKKFGAKRVSALLNDASFAKVLHSLGINSILDSRQAVVSKILHFIRKGGIETIATFNNDEVEVISIDVFNNSHAVGMLTDDITTKGEVEIAILARGDKIFILPRKVLISSGDKIIFIIKKHLFEKISKLFQEKPKYLI